MMWPPSCHAASPWNTPTLRTSPSLTKETGWNDGGEGENRRNTGRMEVPHPPAVSHPCTPHLDIKEPKHRYDHLSSLSFFFFCLYLVICLSRCGLCSVEGLHVAVVGLSSVPRVVFLSLSFFEFILLHLPRDFVSAGFLVMKSLMFTIGIHEDNFFEEPLVFVSYLYLDVGEKQKQRRNLKRTNEGMLHLSLVLQYGFAEHGIE